MSADLSALLLELERVLAALSPEEIPRLVGDLEKLQAIAYARLTAAAVNDQPRPAGAAHDELLDIEEAAHRLSLSTDWLYRRAKELPFTVRLGRGLRFSARGIERYIHQRQGR